MVEIPKLVEESTTSINTLNKGNKPVFTEGLCSICQAAMELAENNMPTCSQCGMTAEQAKATNQARKAPAPKPTTSNIGWFQESAEDRGNEIYVDIPKTCNNHKTVPQSNDVKPDLGMPRKKPRNIEEYTQEGDQQKKREQEEREAERLKKASQASTEAATEEQAAEPTQAGDKPAGEATGVSQAQGTPPKRRKDK